MFRLLRYFSLASAAALVLAALIVVLWARAAQEGEHLVAAHGENLRVAQAFHETFWPEFSPYVGSLQGGEPEALARRGETRALAFAFRTLTGGTGIAAIDIVRADGLVVFSGEAARIGSVSPILPTPGNRRVALADGRRMAETVLPLKAGDGTLEGVLILGADVTEGLKRVDDNTLGLAGIVAGSFLALYLLLFLIVRRADRILVRQHAELRRQGDELLAAKERFQAIADYSYDWEAWFDPRGRLVWVNPAVERITGHSPADVLAMDDPFSVLVQAGDAARLEAHLAAAGRGEAAMDVEFRLARKDGRTAWAAASYQPIRGEAGRPLGSRWSIRDVTDRKRAETRLRESEFRFRQVTQAANDAIVSMADDGTVASWNQGATAMFGYEEAEIVGRPATLLMPECFRDGHEMAFRRRLAADEPPPLRPFREFRGRRMSGAEFPLELSLSEWRMDGRTYFTAIVRDITERHQAEARLRRTLEELLVSNAELERFAHIASHDLQEPARQVVCYAQLLERQMGADLGEENREFLGFVVSGARRMQSLVRDLLAYARANRHESAPSRCEAGLPLAAALESLGPEIERTAARIETGPLPAVLADADRLADLFRQLLDNAIKFVRPGAAPVVTVGAQRNGGMAVFSVADNGIGIEPRYFDQIFSVFKRLHTLDAYPGTGIGLALCRRIVERHGGRIWVESRPGEGSTFRFTLPLAPENDSSGG
jgi:PAS domain S-box-containing protein